MGDGATLQEIDTGANACSVEWCPIAGLESYVACSTYLLAVGEQGDSTEEEGSKSHDVGDAACVTVDTRSSTSTAASGGGEGEEKDAGAGQKRSGSIVIHRLVHDKTQTPPPPPPGEQPQPSNARLEESARASLDGGVLDAKWSQHAADDGSAVLACVTSTGRLVFYSLSNDDDVVGRGAELRQVASSDIDDSLLLSLDWSRGPVADAKIVVSQSDGRLAIWRLNPAGGAPVQAVEPWHAHSLRGGVPTEAWISFFRRGGGGEDGSFVVSGADDGLMKGWDLKVGGAGGAVSPAFVCKEHGAGVTAGQWHPSRPHTFASGSYDESVRVWDARALHVPVTTTPTGGGLWRLKWHPDPDRGNLLLAACMHHGVSILDIGSGSGSGSPEPEMHAGGGADPSNKSEVYAGLETGSSPGLGAAATIAKGVATRSTGVVAEYTRHGSMAYGADWCSVSVAERNSRPLVASCSFYDNLLCLWRTPPLWVE